MRLAACRGAREAPELPAPVSVVVPTLNAAPDLGPMLGALSEALFDGLIREVIIADGGSTDGIRAISEATGARLVEAPPGRGTQLAAGCRAAEGAWLLVMHADTLLPEGWSRHVRQHIARCPDRAGWFRLRFDQEGAWPRLVAGWANLRARLLALPYGDQGLLIPRSLYDAAGGYREVPLMEDVDLVRRIGRRRLRGIAAFVTTSAARYRREGWFRRGARNLATLALWRLGVPPARLARIYERRR